MSSKHLKTKWNCKLEARFYVFFLSITPGKQTNLQAHIVQEMQDSYFFSHVTIRTKYLKEEIDK